ncbi:MAG: hypothetical protein Q4P13_10675 [Psychrobacter sp.]|nr:hypothetical protein [Psychrobacter sp.]
MRLQAVLVAIGIGVSLAIGATGSTVVSHGITKDSVDKSFSKCLGNAEYEGDSVKCMMDAYESYDKIAQTLPHNNRDTELYHLQLGTCSEIDNQVTSMACALSAVKLYMHNGDIVQYMSNGKYHSSQ